jgi:trigger factor
MNISQEQIDELNARVTIEIAPEDYDEPVTKTIDGYRKQMKLQGFRPGKVPFGVAKKMYGKSALADHLNKILTEKLNSHIQDNKLNILGRPLPSSAENMDLEFNKKFTFKYDLGLAPAFEIDLSSKDKFNHYKIQIDDDLINKYVRDFQRRFGKSEEVDAVGEKDMIYGSFYELDKSGERKVGGVHNHSTVVVEYVEHKDSKQKLMGAKVGDKLTVEPAKLCKGDADLSAMIGVPVSELSELGKQFELKIDSIHRIEMHPLNKELFDRVLGPNAAETEVEFKEKISADLAKFLANDSEKKLRRDISDKLLEKLKLQLPDAFLKRWLLEAGANNEKPVTQADIDREYEDYVRYLRLQLIESKIATDNGIKVEFIEIEDNVKNNVRAQFAGFGQAEIPEDLINQFAQNTLKNEEEVRKIYDHLLDQKMMAFYHETVKLQEKEVSFDEFVKLASTKAGKGGLMDQISNFLKF